MSGCLIQDEERSVGKSLVLDAVTLDGRAKGHRK